MRGVLTSVTYCIYTYIVSGLMICFFVADALLTDVFWMIAITALWGITLTLFLMAKWGSVHWETFVSKENNPHIFSNEYSNISVSILDLKISCTDQNHQEVLQSRLDFLWVLVWRQVAGQRKFEGSFKQCPRNVFFVCLCKVSPWIYFSTFSCCLLYCLMIIFLRENIPH